MFCLTSISIVYNCSNNDVPKLQCVVIGHHQCLCPINHSHCPQETTSVSKRWISSWLKWMASRVTREWCRGTSWHWAPSSQKILQTLWIMLHHVTSCYIGMDGEVLLQRHSLNRRPHLLVSFSRMRSKGSRFTLGVWGLRVCSLDVAFTVATVRNRPQPFATVRARTIWPCLWEVLQRWSFLEVSDVALLRFAWQAWHFVTFRRVLERVESRFAWQAQYFCEVFRRCVAVFVAGAALWTCPSSFFVAGAAL